MSIIEILKESTNVSISKDSCKRFLYKNSQKPVQIVSASFFWKVRFAEYFFTKSFQTIPNHSKKYSKPFQIVAKLIEQMRKRGVANADLPNLTKSYHQTLPILPILPISWKIGRGN